VAGTGGSGVMRVVFYHPVTLPVRVEWDDAGRVCSVKLLPRSQRQKLPARLARQLSRYFRGERVSFRISTDSLVGTEFQRKVWRVLQTIPYGETRTYAWVARKIGHPKAARAVGVACGANPIPLIIPCHRVVASDGSLGGFSAGLVWKRRLLVLEQRRLSSDRRA
jgi:methylated-DNA-[protein]-cysteine S-methyltransferase